MDEKLKRCPFCGKKPYSHIEVIKSYSTYTLRFTVRCVECDINKYFDVCCAESFKKIESAMYKAVEAWNRRADNGKV